MIDSLLQTREHTQKRIVASSYKGKRGNPVLFDVSLFPELLTVSGDEGGRSVIAHHPQDVEMVEVKETMASHDVDTWEAYQQALTAWQERQNHW
jgi:molybdenum cofactor cytidylyltransferase